MISKLTALLFAATLKTSSAQPGTATVAVEYSIAGQYSTVSTATGAQKTIADKSGCKISQIGLYQDAIDSNMLSAIFLNVVNCDFDGDNTQTGVEYAIGTKIQTQFSTDLTQAVVAVSVCYDNDSLNVIGLKYKLLDGVVVQSGVSCDFSNEIPPNGWKAGKLVGFAGLFSTSETPPTNYMLKNNISCFFMCEPPKFSASSYDVYKQSATGSLSTISFYNVPCKLLNISVMPSAAFITLSQGGDAIQIDWSQIAVSQVGSTFSLTLINFDINDNSYETTVQVTIKDQCQYGSFIAPAANSLDFVVALQTSTVTQTKALQVLTNVGSSGPMTCPYNAAIYSTPFSNAVVTISAAYDAIMVDPLFVLKPTEIGVQTVIIRIRSPDYNVGVVEFSISVNVQCDVTTVSTKAITAQSYSIGQGLLKIGPLYTAQTFDCLYPITKSLQFKFNGTVTVALFANLNQNVIEINTLDIKNVGNWSVTITATIDQVNPQKTLTAAPTSFDLTIVNNCLGVTSLSFAAVTDFSPTLNAKSAAVPQYSQQISVLRTPNCSENISFTQVSIVPAPPQNVQINLQSVSATIGKLSVSGLQVADVGKTFFVTVEVQASNASTALQKQFTLTISLDCATAKIQAPTQALQNMSILNNFGQNVMTQAFSVKTDLEVNYNFLCQLNYSLSPANSFVSLTPSNGGVTIQISQNALSLPAQTVPFQIFVSSTASPGTVQSTTHNFDVVINDCIVSSFVMDQLPFSQLTYNVRQAQLTKTFTPPYWSPSCTSYPMTFFLNQWIMNAWVPVLLPFLSVNMAQGSLTISTNNSADIGDYIFLLQASLTNPTGAQAIASVGQSFSLQISVINCSNSAFISRSLAPLVAQIGQKATLNIFFDDTEAKVANNQNECGPRAYTIDPVYSFISIQGDFLVAASINPAEVGSYQISLTVALLKYPTVQPLTTKIQVDVQCIVKSIVAGIKPPATNDYRIKVDGPLVLPFYFARTPQCSLTYSISPPLPFQVQLDSYQQQITIATTSTSHKGTYALRLRATPALGPSTFVDFTVNIVDVCDFTEITWQKIESLELLRQMADFKPIQTIQMSTISHTALKLYNLDCGGIKVRLEPIISWITLDESSLKITVDLTSQKFCDETVDVTAYLPEYPARSLKQSFNVTLSDIDFKCMQVGTERYFVGSPPLKFSVAFQNQTWLSQHTKQSLTPVFAPVGVNSKGIEEQLPQFVTFDSAQMAFLVEGSKAEPGDFTVGLKMGYVETGTVTCKSKLIVQPEPTYSDFQIEDQLITCSRPWSYQIPQIKDPVGNKVILDVKLGQTKEFLSFDPQSTTLKTSDLDVQTFARLQGSYTIKVDLTDSTGNQKHIDVKIIVSCQADYEAAQLYDHSQAISSLVNDDFKREQLKPYIKQINQLGQIRIAFNRLIVLPTFAIFPEFISDPDLCQNCTSTQGRELKTTQAVFEALEIVNKGKVRHNGELKRLFDIFVLPGEQSDASRLYFEWTCKDVHQGYMDFQVRFQHYQEVSANEDKERLQISFNGPMYFQSTDGEHIQGTNLKLERVLPPQMSPTAQKYLGNAALTVANSSKAVVVIQFVLNLLLGSALQELFAKMRKMSLMVHLLIINVAIPGNAQYFFSKLLQLVSFNFIDITELMRNFFRIHDETINNQNMLDLGYVSNYFVINMGNLFLVFVYLILLFFLLPCAKRVTKPILKKVIGYFFDGLCWNAAITFVSESFLVLSISCYTNYLRLDWKRPGLTTSSVLALLSALVLIFYPVFSFLFLCRNKHQLHEKATKDTYGSLYSHLKFKKGGATLFEPAIYQLRILTLTAALIYLQDLPYWQIFLVNFQCTFLVIYTGLVEPYASKEFQFFENFNESFICFTNYHLIAFEYMNDQKAREIMGWSLIGCISANLLTNFAFILNKSLRRSYHVLRVKYYLRKRARLRERIRRRAEEVQSNLMIDEVKVGDIPEELRYPYRPELLQISEPQVEDRLSVPVKMLPFHPVIKPLPYFLKKMAEQEKANSQPQPTTIAEKDGATSFKSNAVLKSVKATEKAGGQLEAIPAKTKRHKAKNTKKSATTLIQDKDAEEESKESYDQLKDRAHFDDIYYYERRERQATRNLAEDFNLPIYATGNLANEPRILSGQRNLSNFRTNDDF